jgi:hypothetical protein
MKPDALFIACFMIVSYLAPLARENSIQEEHTVFILSQISSLNVEVPKLCE